MRFNAIGVNSRISSLLSKFNLVNCTKVQEIAFKPVYESKNVMIESPTGTGKTLAYLLPLIQKLEKEQFPPKSTVIVAPTRELAVQIFQQAKLLIPPQFENQVSMASSGLVKEEIETSPKTSLLVATPAGLGDILRKDTRWRNKLQTLVIDEADQLIQPLGRYAPEKQRKYRASHPLPTESILNHLCFNHPLPQPKTKVKPLAPTKWGRLQPQIVFVSATLGSKMKREAHVNQWINSMEIVSPVQKSKSKLAHSLSHYCFECSEPDIETDETYLETQCSGLISSCKLSSAFVFAPPEVSITDVVQRLQSRMKNANVVAVYESVHLKSSVDELLEARNKLVETFQTGTPQKPVVGVISWNSVRGFDLPNVQMAILVGVPHQQDQYIHLAGRVGRVDKFGDVVTLCLNQKEKTRLERWTKRLSFQLHDVNKLIDKKMGKTK